MKPNLIADAMADTYDRYVRNDGYSARYPRPNPSTLDYLLRNGAADAERILDFGCGNGRYALALLERCHADITAYDISAASLAQFEDQLSRTPFGPRVRLVHGNWSRLGRSPRYDMILMLFGVLSHLGDRATRIAALKRMRGLIGANGRLIVSVPSVLRRRPRELLKWSLARRMQVALPPLSEHGNIYFTRHVGGQPLTFFYHLYSPKRLSGELAAAGFAVQACEAESLLPEWWVAQSRALSGLDRLAARLLPPALGYGIRVLAVPV
ncbi:class I SAM-dependent methyltransferase [Trinickia diaoshuihuensis]|uniref:class I SAM-dependent methyltransferase n=1 Tax=Trinickia diaoshuihuensis TaxID=2292265 RepID=UPI0013C37639|nr:class I SAM-dependent methyltransferase [Trinickia diaoshuihuensis]